MRVLFWFCEEFGWVPAMKTLETVPEALPETHHRSVVAFVHVEPHDVAGGGKSETRLVKTAKWLARKWSVESVVLHSFTHLGTEKADPGPALDLMDRASRRLVNAGYRVTTTPYGYFNDLVIRAPGHPLARVYKEF